MKFRHTFLICRVTAFALLLATAGATSLTVANVADRESLEERQQNLAVRDLATPLASNQSIL